MTTGVVYDPLDPETLENPHPVLAVLRAARPVSWNPGLRSWLLTRYSDCVAVLRDHERFARDRRRVGGHLPEASRSVQSLDPPEQAAVRTLFMNAVRAEDLGALEQRAYGFAASLWSAHADDETFDVADDVAVPLALFVVADLLGVDQPDLRSFSVASDTIMRSMDGGLDPSTVEPGRVAREELTRLVDGWFRTSAAGGVLGRVASHITSAGDPDLDVYVRNTARVMFQGGYSTTTAAIGNVIHTLLEHTECWETLRDRDTLRTGVDELVRFDGPVQGTSRFATASMQLGDVTVGAGDTVLLSFPAANRDPEQFTDPDEIRLTRSPNPHLGYGWGTHACIGTTPAQAAVRAVVAGLLDQPNTLRRAGRPVRRRTATMRTFESLPVSFRRRPGVR